MNPSNPQQQNPYLEVVTGIGNTLLKNAIHYRQLCNWQGAVLEQVRGNFQVVDRTFGPDLYNGLSGILWFLSEWYPHNPSPLVLEAINGTLQNIYQLTEQPGDELGHFSIHSGMLGAAFSLWRCGRQMGAEQWRQAGLQRLETLYQQPIGEHEVDVIGGAAGAIPVLLKIYEAEDEQRCLTLAVRLGDFLLETARKQGNHCFWPQPGSQAGLTGYSHGNGGIGLALLELGVLIGESRFVQGAQAAFNFEREHFNPAYQNWPDLRELNTTPQYNYMWCHGAPGIAISRIRAFQLTQDQSYLQEARIALESTWRDLSQTLVTQPHHINFSLCHGAAGNAEILLLGSQLLQEAKYAQLAQQVADFGIQTYFRTETDWPSGVHDSAGQGRSMEPTPGLMLGLAGTGLFYLHLGNPQRIESPLLIR